MHVINTKLQNLKIASATLCHFILKSIVPPYCIVCKDPVIEDGAVCGACWPEFIFIADPICDVTGAPFAFNLGKGMLSAEAIANPPDFTRARAATLYNLPARRLVSRLKYSDDTALAPWMAQWMHRAGKNLWDQCDVIIPVPLHKSRLLHRRYNQSAELGRALASQTGYKFNAHALTRVKRTSSQVGLSKTDRAKNVLGAFQISAHHKIDVAGRNIVLVDDVLTTGATVNACARTLKRAGAKRVDVLTFSRVPLGGFDMAL